MSTHIARAQEAIASWYRSGVGFDFKSMKGGSETSPFTAMLWRQTTHAGFGFDSIQAGVVAVVFWPAGNEEGAFEENLRPRLVEGLMPLRTLPEPEKREVHGRVVDPNNRGIAEVTVSSPIDAVAWTDREGLFHVQQVVESTTQSLVFRCERLNFAPAIVCACTATTRIEAELLPVTCRARFSVQNGVTVGDAESGLRFVIPPDAVIDRGEEIELMVAVPKSQNWGLPVAPAQTLQGRQPLQVLSGIWWSIRGALSGIAAELRPGMAAQVSFLVRPSWAASVKNSDMQQIQAYVLDEKHALWNQVDTIVSVGDLVLPAGRDNIGQHWGRWDQKCDMGELQPFLSRLDAREEADAAAAADAQSRGARVAAVHAEAVAKVAASERADPSCVLAKQLGLIARTLCGPLNMPFGAPTLDEALDALTSTQGSVEKAAKILSELPSTIVREISARAMQEERRAVAEIKAGVARMGLEAVEIGDEEALKALGLDLGPRFLFREHLLSAPPFMHVWDRIQHMRNDPEILARLNGAAEMLAYDRGILVRDVAAAISLTLRKSLIECGLPEAMNEDALVAARLVLDVVPSYTLSATAVMQPVRAVPDDDTFKSDAAHLLEAFTRVRFSSPELGALDTESLEVAAINLSMAHGNDFRQFVKQLDWQALCAETLRSLNPFQRSILQQRVQQAKGEVEERPQTAPSKFFMTAASRAATPATPASKPVEDWQDALVSATGGKELRLTALAPSPGWACWGGPCSPAVVAARVASCVPGSQVLATSSCFGIVRWHGVVACGAVNVLATSSSEVSLHIVQKGQTCSRSSKAGEVGTIVLAKDI